MTTTSACPGRARAAAAVLAGAALLACPALAGAGTWLQAYGGGSTFDLDGVQRDDLARGLLDRRDTQTGTLWGGALAWDMGPYGLFGLGYERLRPEVGDLGALSGLTLSSLDLEAEVFRAFLVLQSPRSGGQEVGLGGGVGWLRTRGSIGTVAADGADADAAFAGDLEGDDLVGEVFATVDAFLARRLAVEVAGGYRWARIDNLEAGGRLMVRPDHSAVAVDYSGFFGRVGLKLGLYQRDDQADAAGGDRTAPGATRLAMIEVGAAMVGALPATWFEDQEGAESAYMLTAGWRGGQTAMGFGLRDRVWRDLTRRRVTTEDGRLFGYVAYHPYDPLTGPFLKVESGAWEKLQDGQQSGQGELLPFLGLGSGYRVQLGAGLGIYAEGMTISRAGGRPSVEARLGTSLLLGG